MLLMFMSTPFFLRFKLDNLGGKSCDRCNKMKTWNDIVYHNGVIVHLQDNEKFNDIEKLTVILLDASAEKIKIGERVTVTGSIHIKPKFTKNLLIPMVFANTIERENNGEIVLDEVAIEANKRFAKLKGQFVIQALVRQFDPSIIGNNMVKEALLYSLVCSGNDLMEIKRNKSRNRINVLLAGNPGLGKTGLLKRSALLVQNSRCESMQNSSGKSLTAIVSKEDEQVFLRLGPIPIAKGGVCGLNEIGLMKPEEQNHLLDVMEEGEFTINKHGFNSKIDSPTTIIASTNLKNPRTLDWLTQDIEINTKNPLSQSHLPLTRQLLDRFDLIVVVKDNGDFEALEEYTENKMNLHDTKLPSYDLFLKRYLEFARKIKPILTPESKNMIKNYYINLQMTNPARESRRTLDTIIRLCKAVAKLRLKESVESEDVTYATKFYNSVIFNFDGSKANVPKDPITYISGKIFEFLKKDMGEYQFTDLLKNLSLENEFVRKYIVGSYLGDIEDHKISLENNKKSRKICELLRHQSNIVTVNKSPIIIKYLQDDSVSHRSEGSDRSDQAIAVTTSSEN